MGPVMAPTLKQSISLLAAMGLNVDVSGEDYRLFRASQLQAILQLKQA